MFKTLAAKLVVPALAVLALSCDAQQTTSPSARNALASSGKSGSSTRNTTIVLIHGAWADGTGWDEIIPILQRDGYKVIAVQNPLVSMANDVETTKRVIDGETAKGRNVVAVAHSYGGAVMSGAAAGNPGVKALVYIAAFAPDAGERLDTFIGQYPTDIFTAFEPDAAGFVYLSADKYRPIFAGDLPESRTRVMAVSQKPTHGAIFGQSNPVAAWRTVPSWFVVAQEDRVINPDLERFYAGRMAAAKTLVKKIEIRASHVVFISRPNEVGRIILDAAGTAGQ
jgi:pimeloyl-ACP methyl ester carboxylesterase